MEQSLKDQAGVTDDQIRDAIQEGPVTKQYLADPQSIIRSLNQLRSTEITSYLQYKQHSYMAVSLLSPGLKTEFEAHAEQELAHADRLASRIQQLGGVPIFDLRELAGKAAAVGVHPEQGTTLTAYLCGFLFQSTVDNVFCPGMLGWKQSPPLMSPGWKL